MADEYPGGSPGGHGRARTFVEDHCGQQVPDPYRWLEDSDSDEMAQFVKNQNAVTMPYYLAGCEAEGLGEQLQAERACACVVLLKCIQFHARVHSASCPCTCICGITDSG